MTTPRDPASLEELAGAYRLSQLVHATAELAIPDQLAAGGMTAEALAAALEVDPGALQRLLWVLVAEGILAAAGDGRFEQTEFSARLCSGGLRTMLLGWRCLPAKYEAFGALADCVRSGRPFAHDEGGLYSYFERNPAAAAAYDAAMDTTSDGFEAVGRAFDFSRQRVVVDVGGGHGGLIVALLRRYPQLRGVVFDLPGVAAQARRRLEHEGLASRASSVGGDMFERVPDGGDVYVLSTVLRCFPDERCRAILRNCRAAMPAGARLLAAEMVHPGGPWEHPARMADLDALVLYGGADRTAAQWRELLEDCGFTLDAIRPCGDPMSLVCATARP